MKAMLSKTEKRLQSSRYGIRSDQPKKPPKSSYHRRSATDFSTLVESEKKRKFER